MKRTIRFKNEGMLTAIINRYNSEIKKMADLGGVPKEIPPTLLLSLTNIRTESKVDYETLKKLDKGIDINISSFQRIKEFLVKMDKNSFGNLHQSFDIEFEWETLIDGKRFKEKTFRFVENDGKNIDPNIYLVDQSLDDEKVIKSILCQKHEKLFFAKDEGYISSNLMIEEKKFSDHLVLINQSLSRESSEVFESIDNLIQYEKSKKSFEQSIKNIITQKNNIFYLKIEHWKKNGDYEYLSSNRSFFIFGRKDVQYNIVTTNGISPPRPHDDYNKKTTINGLDVEEYYLPF